MAIFHSDKQKWLEFRKRVFPLPNPKKLSNLSLSQIDGFAASVYSIAYECGIDFNIIHFNRIEGVFQFNWIQHPESRSFLKVPYEDFEMGLLFLEYLYNIDRKNKFCREYVQFGSERKFSQLWHFFTAERVYFALKKIKKTDELIRAFFKKIELGKDYRHITAFWEEMDPRKPRQYNIV